MRFPELADAQVGEVRTLCTCTRCDRVVRVRVDARNQNYVLTFHRGRRKERERCLASGTDCWLALVYSLQEKRRSRKSGGVELKRVWVRANSVTV